MLESAASADERDGGGVGHTGPGAISGTLRSIGQLEAARDTDITQKSHRDHSEITQVS